MHIGEKMFITKKFRRKFPVYAIGSLTVDCQSKETGKFVRTLGPKKNAFFDQAFDIFSELITGVKDHANHHLSLERSSLGITNSSGGTTFTRRFLGADNILYRTPVKSSPSYSYQWVFEDKSIDTYNVPWVQLWVGDPNDGNNFDDYTYRIGELNANFGTKPADENWIYRYGIEFYSTDGDFTDIGMQHLLDLIANFSDKHIDVGGVRLRPTVTGGGAELPGSNLAPDSVTLHPPSNEIRIQFTAGDGVFNGTWGATKIKIRTPDFSDNLRWGGCKTDGSSCGTKSDGEEWVYRYDFSLGQGS